MDAAFQFGDVAILLNLNPRSKSIADLIPELQAGGELESLDTFTVAHSSGAAGPARAADAGDRRPHHARRRSSASSSCSGQTSDLVVVDCPAWFSDTTLAILDSRGRHPRRC